MALLDLRLAIAPFLNQTPLFEFLLPESDPLDFGPKG